MSGFETRFAADDDAEQIRAAFYGFVEQHADCVDGDAHIATEIDTRGQRLLVRLWSAEALDAFVAKVSAGERRRSFE